MVITRRKNFQLVLEKRILIKSLLLIVFCIQLSNSVAIVSREKRDVVTDEDAVHYLQRFGYINESLENGRLPGICHSDSVMDFQTFAGITQTGRLDEETIKMMNSPRCGNKDRVIDSEIAKRMKPFITPGTEWKPTHLTYRISKYPTEFLTNKHVIDRQIAKAFKIWSEVTPLSFESKNYGRVHIDIRFVESIHGCKGGTFGGPGKTLAHAHYGGPLHFHNEEHWTISSSFGTNLFQMASHVLGHSLGLGHSSVRDSVMAPFYERYKPDLTLHEDDIHAIQALYGIKPMGCDHSDKPGKPADLESYPPDLCQNSSVDAVTQICDSTFIFKGIYYWKVEANGLAEGYPRRISTDWDGLPGNLDAALTWTDGKTFFFKDTLYWSFENMQMDEGYPKPISTGFPGIPDNIDAALVWSGNGKTYFFKGNQYWRYDRNADPRVHKEYPYPMEYWKGLPNSIDTAFKWKNGMSYFFKGPQYFRYNDIDDEVDTKATPSFPRPIAQWWFDCVSLK